MKLTRRTAGVLVGTLLATLGPIGVTVASHSGNDPAQRVEGSAAAASRRGAYASWTVKSGTTTKTYAFGVWSASSAEATAGTASSETTAGHSGGSYATLKTCSPSCVTTTIRGPSGMSGPTSADGGATYADDPTLERATYTGVLAKSDGTGACTFTVEWRATADLQQTQISGMHGSLAGQDVWRWARATVRSTCWPTLQNGDGKIWRSLAGDARQSVRI